MRAKDKRKDKRKAAYTTPDSVNGEDTSHDRLPSPLMSFWPCSATEPRPADTFQTPLA